MDDVDLLARFMARHAQILARSSAQVLRLWVSMPGYDRPDVPEFTAAASQVVEANQLAAALLVDGYIAKAAGTSPAGLTAEVVTNLREGITTAEAYQRPFLRLWRLRAEGVAEQAAQEQARTYLSSMAQMDTQLAVSHAMVEASDRIDGVVGYRRVLTGKSCRFCATAATQRYHTRQLRPLHSGCDCGVAPIIGDRDPGRVVNDQLLARLKEQGPRYWEKRGFVDSAGNPIDPTQLGPVRTDRNAEIGPVLVTA